MGPYCTTLLLFSLSHLTRSLYDIPQSIQKHFISAAGNLLSIFAISLHVSQTCRISEITSDLIDLILELGEIFLLSSSILSSYSVPNSDITAVVLAMGKRSVCSRVLQSRAGTHSASMGTKLTTEHKREYHYCTAA